jgi:7-cyano-7-deazaguanine synthase in queuosine biosynthesis
MPVLNYGLFSSEIRLKFPVSTSDFSLLNDLLDLFTRDIFINKFVRRKNPYILPQFLPLEHEITLENARPTAKIVPLALTEDAPISQGLTNYSCGILSSGGKESLLTYAMLKEIGAEVHPLYVNESGGHWRTALAAYRKFAREEHNTGRVWTNVDRFYSFMLDNMRIIRPNHRKVWSDTYPIRLCIFPVYVFLFLPVFARRKIGNLLIGSELDDPRTSPLFKGIKHYFGVYDQTQDFDLKMEQWYLKRMPEMRQWSAVRSISGLVVERILAKRYPELAKVQRSCHSCRFEKGKIIPCGQCSKCQGVLLFLLANGVNPSIMEYQKEDALSLPERIAKGELRLDEDEREHAIFLSKMSGLAGRQLPHVESIHLHKSTSDIELIPTRFRIPLLRIMMEYTKGFTKLEGDAWVPTDSPEWL